MNGRNFWGVLTQRKVEGLHRHMERTGIPADALVAIGAHILEEKHGGRYTLEFMRTLVSFMETREQKRKAGMERARETASLEIERIRREATGLD